MDIVEKLRAGWIKPIATPTEFGEAADEIERLRSELARAVRDIERLGEHSATIAGCLVCNTVRSYGFDPEALREEVGGGGAAK